MTDTSKPRRLHVAVQCGIVLVLAALTAGGVWWLLKSLPETPPGKDDPGRDAGRVPAVRFTDITEQAGIRFRHTNGAFGKKLLPETMGSGVAFLDYDNDGKQDLLFINSCYWPGDEKGRPNPTLALYHNEGHDTFKDVTRGSGLDVAMYGMGVTVGDYDNDGWPDVFVTGVGGNRLFHNEADGQGGRRFVEVTTAAGVGGPGGWPAVRGGDFLQTKTPLNFSSSATFLDYDGDGRLDLFVCNYVEWSPAFDLSQGFTLGGATRAYGPPRAFQGAQCFLYRNQGNGRFEDVSRAVGIHEFDAKGVPAGKSLGVVACDVDQDGWPDLVVANDTVRNFFFHNEPDGKGGRHFRQMGAEVGIAFSSSGQEQGAMGADYGEYRPEHFALLIGNFANEPNTFMRLSQARDLSQGFRDVARAEGIEGASRPWLKFGVFFFDYDLDGRLDIMTCNGHLEPEIARVGQLYEQPAQLFWNTGGKPCFEEVKPARAGPDLFKPQVGRGCAFADINGDGTLDVVHTRNGGPARLLRNEGGTGNHWLRLVLEGDGARSNRSAIGARVVLQAGGQRQEREVIAGRGYLSQSELPLTFGLGKATQVERVTIFWPGQGRQPPQVLRDLKVDHAFSIRQSGPS